MNTWVALLRGINVGGHRKLPMAELIQLATRAGGVHPRTYIQSGNLALLAHRDPGPALGAEIERARGFRPEILTLSLSDFAAALSANPFPDAVDQPKTLHLFFLSGPPEPGAEARLEERKSEAESFLLSDTVLYLHSPKLLTGSRIAPVAERLLGTAATARNWRSAERILAMAREVDRKGASA